MSARPRAAISWSGGKDSCAALRRAGATYDVVAMITMFDERGARSRSHGLRPEVLATQADRLGLIPIVGLCTWDTYDEVFAAALVNAARADITHVIFGDILFEEHRQWAERMCAAAGLIAVEPLFGSSTHDLFLEWIASGDEATIVTARAECLDASWLGRRLDVSMLPEFERLGVDPCGERGEYHTVVTRTALFHSPIDLTVEGQVQHSGCWALDVGVADAGRA